MGLRAAILLCLLCAPAAAEEPSIARVAVDLARPAGGAGWFAAGLEQVLGRELLRFQRVRLVPPLGGAACPGREVRCLLEAYRQRGADLVVLGRLAGARLEYGIYPTWTGTRAEGGAIDVAGVSTATLERRVSELLRPIVQRGGLLDERPQLAERPAPIAPASAGSFLDRLALLALVGLLALLGLPPLLALVLVGPARLKAQLRPESWKWSAFGAGLVATLLVVTRGDLHSLVARPVPGWLERLSPLAGGMLWAAFVLIHLRWAFAPIEGLGRVRDTALWPILRSWLALSLLRCLLLGAYAPVALLALDASEALALSLRATWTLALPAAGLLACFWLLTLVDNLTLVLDVRLVSGAASERNPWHSTARRYLQGYLRRLGVDLDDHLVDRTLFLPSGVAEVISYGGGFARPRILLGAGPRELALGELPDEHEAPEREVHPEELPLGILTPREHPPARRGRAPLPPRRHTAKPKLIGAHLTLLGWVLPQPGGDGLPLIASTQEELEIVQDLLQEHYQAFAKHDDDDEVDDTDPTQKDFLYGALIRELGAISRGDTLLATLRQALALGMRRASRPSQLLLRLASFLHARSFAGPGARVADAYAAFHGGLHHLIQHLELGRGGAPRLTARASMPQLIASSKAVLDGLARERPPREWQQAAARNRLLFLARFFHVPLVPRARRLGGLAVALVVGALIALGAAHAAWTYHPIYEERMHGRSQEER